MKRLLCSILVLMMAGATVQAQPPTEQTLTDLGLLEKRDQLKEKWQADKDANNLDDARPKAELLADLERKLVHQLERSDPGDVEHLQMHRRELAQTLNWLAREYEHDNVFDKAVLFRKEYVGLRETMLGNTDWRVITDNLYLDFVELLSQKTPAEHQQIANARELFAKGKDHYLKDLPDFEEAIKAFQERLRIQQQVLGEDDYQTVSSRTWLASLYDQSGDYAKAEPLYQQSLEINLKHLGEEHPNTANVRNNCALLYKNMGNYEEAKRFYEQSFEVNKKVLGERDRETVNVLANLGVLSMWLGDYALAKRQLTKALQIREEVLKEDHSDTAVSRQNLALLYTITGDHANAEPLYRQALTILDKPSMERAQVLENMGVLYKSMGGKLSEDGAKLKYDEAEKKFHEALTIYNKIFDKNHPSVIRLRNNLALLHKMRGDDETDDDDEANRCYHAALEQYKKILGEELFGADGSFSIHMLEDENLSLALTLNNLASLYESQGNFARAESLYQKALDIRQQNLGEEHIETAVSLSNLGLLKLTLGHADEARKLVEKSLGIRRHMLDAMATVQTERQQLLMNQNLRYALDDWLSVVNDESAYAAVLHWKGTVFVRQAHLRALRSNPELTSLVNELRCVSCALAELALGEGKGQGQNEWGRMSDQRGQLETQLTEQSEQYRQAKEQALRPPADLQKLLPEKTALVDLLQYDRFIPPKADEHEARWERQFVAFVVRRDAVHRIELGPAKTIDKLVDRWHEESRADAASTLTEPAIELRRLVWQPLETHLERIQTVLVSPDGSLGKLPFAALPGKESETYLLEDLTVVLIPVPQTLLGMLDPVSDSNKSKADDEEEVRMLVLGGIDFDGDAGTAADPTTISGRRPLGGLPYFKYLKKTKSEARYVRDQFEDAIPDGRLDLKLSQDATEETVRELAPQSMYLHFATHGYFAPEELVSALDNRGQEGKRGGGTFDQQRFLGYDPGLLSGLALAGANRHSVEGDDGVLSALEVAEMDLSKVRLAVLSACETGLGREAGGEGLLGLQRSFHVAGARSVVATLWSINDKITRELMEGFYDNVWKGKISKIQAMREAQLSILNDAEYRGINKKSRAADSANNPRAAPEKWAAFVLSGDWR